MKLFRKLTVLTLSVLLIAALSASALAANTRSDFLEIDDESYMTAYSSITQSRVSVDYEIYAIGLNPSDSNIDIRMIYNYETIDGNATWNERGYSGYYYGADIVSVINTGSDDIDHFTSANFSVYMRVYWNGDYHVLNPANFMLIP